MLFIDCETSSKYTTKDIYESYTQFKTEDTTNHAESFTRELYSILMDTLNGRNNLHIIGNTKTEIENYIFRLAAKI